MDQEKKKKRYIRLRDQIKQLMSRCEDRDARMATISAVLYHKMDCFFWTGFYLLTQDNELVVKSYQGPVACMQLAKEKGVCWAGVLENRTIVVDDVCAFPGHIACDSRSKSEIVVPVRDTSGKVIGVLDVDSKELSSFDNIDQEYLEEIVKLIYI
ncbi:MAG: GAF domain-containing protein [Hyphomicrobiales bacterium]